ncbi:MAG TPA: FtsX-like permease family protein, partial [Longimicrobiales bacterium]|nr:FtsX-like permease family protein [Longimicrobiales bacterium]
LLLGSVGLYGVLSFVTAQRTREIGVRIALGAEASSVRGMVLRQGLAVTGAGLVAGLVGAAMLSRFMESVLYEVSATDPLTFVAVPAILLTVAAVATWLPAHRAAGVDPVRALRWE